MIIQPEHINDICYIHFLEITIIISYNHSHINDRWMVYVHMVFFVDWGFNHPCIQWTRCDEWLPHRPEPPGGPTSWRWTQNWLVNSTCIVVFSISHIIYIYIYTVYMIIYIYMYIICIYRLWSWIDFLYISEGSLKPDKFASASASLPCQLRQRWLGSLGSKMSASMERNG